MTDRELLEAAAKAAGLRFDSTPPFEVALDVDGETVWYEWNPLTDDGDALRLAVKLRIKFRYNEALGQALAWLGGAKELDDSRANVEDFDGDEFACARRAIVLAAADIVRAAAATTREGQEP